jgi:hypothetical protein
MPDRVRSHTRKTPTGGTTRVRPHSRTSRHRRALVSPRHSWKLAKRAFRAGRRRKRALAVTLGALAILEIGAWLTVEGVALIATTAGVLAITVGVLAAGAGGVRP